MGTREKKQHRTAHHSTRIECMQKLKEQNQRQMENESEKTNPKNKKKKCCKLANVIRNIAA